MSHVLIVDDEPSICWGFRELLTDEGHIVSVAPSAEDAFDRLNDGVPDAILLDVRLPGMDGLSAMSRLRELTGNVPIIVMTAFGNLETAVRAVQQGAYDYLTKPFHIEQAIEVLQRALDAAGLARQIDGRATAAVGSPTDGLIGSSAAMQAVFKQIALVAATNAPVLITGESGTGKEVAARAIHRHSGRVDKPFVPVCVPSLNPSVIESELFGHVRGAYTGADDERSGLLEMAAGGTVFLDEIGDVPLPLQVKLLRAIEQREVMPVGGSQSKPTDFRIIAATNQPIEQAVTTGEFREDLFYRLSVFRIHLPPLRERREDIADLAAHFLRQFDAGPIASQIDAATLDELCTRSWYGNVRELRNAVERAAIVARNGLLCPEHLPPPLPRKMGNPVGGVETLQSQIQDWVLKELAADGNFQTRDLYERFLALTEPPLLAATLGATSANRTVAARILGIHRATLRQKLSQHGVAE